MHLLASREPFPGARVDAAGGAQDAVAEPRAAVKEKREKEKKEGRRKEEGREEECFFPFPFLCEEVLTCPLSFSFSCFFQIRKRIPSLG